MRADEPDVDALVAVQLREPAAELDSEHAGERGLGRLDDRHLGPEAASS